LRNEESNDVYSWPSIIKIIKSRRMRWACSMNVAKRNAYKILVRKVLVGGWVILKQILER
jgi:hypothetical protein